MCGLNDNNDKLSRKKCNFFFPPFPGDSVIASFAILSFTHRERRYACLPPGKARQGFRRNPEVASPADFSRKNKALVCFPPPLRPTTAGGLGSIQFCFPRLPGTWCRGDGAMAASAEVSSKSQLSREKASCGPGRRAQCQNKEWLQIVTLTRLNLN